MAVTANTGNAATRFQTIEFLRFIAALMVIIFHATLYTSERLDATFPLYEQGSNGVPLFFVISGFVMVVSSTTLTHAVNGWKVFATKRAIRIVPIYWIVTTFKLLAVAVAASVASHHDLEPGFVLKSYLFVPSENSDGALFPFYNVGWTLNFEVFFYLLFTIALAIRLKPVVPLSGTFLLLCCLSFFKSDSWPDVRFYCDLIVINFIFGMIAARLILAKRKLSRYLAPATILLALLYLFLPRPTTITSGVGSDRIALYVSSFLAVYAAASMETVWAKRIPSLLLVLGGASYSLYLIHPLVAPVGSVALKALHLRWPWLAVLSGVVGSIVAGALFSAFVEQPIARLCTSRLLKRSA